MSSREYSKLTVNVLKEELKRRSLDQIGKKVDLVARLEKDDVVKEENKLENQQSLNSNEDTNNTEEFNTDPKDLSEVNKTDGGPSFNNSFNNNNDDESYNNVAVNRGAQNFQMDSNINNQHINAMQQQQDLTSTTNNNTNSTQGVVDTTSTHRVSSGASNVATTTTTTTAPNDDVSESNSSNTNNNIATNSSDINNVGNSSDNINNVGNSSDNINNVGNSSDNINNAGNSSDNISNVDNSSDNLNNADIQTTSDDNANNNQTTSTTTYDNDSMDTSDTVAKDSNEVSNTTDNNKNTVDTDNNNDEAKSDNNEAKSDNNNEVENPENPQNASETTTDATTTPSDSTTTTVVGGKEGDGGVVEDEKQRVEDDNKITALFCVEMKRDFDAFQLKWHGNKFTVPFLGEIVTDLGEEVSGRSFQASELEREDVMSPVVMAMVTEALKFSIDFNSNVLNPSNIGSVKLTFGSKADCEARQEEMKAFKEDVIISKVKYEDQVNQLYLHRELSFYKGSIVDRLLYVGNLAGELDADCLKALQDLFPKAKRLLIAPIKDGMTARYVYFEYETAESVVEAAEEHKNAEFMDTKLFVIKALCVKKERYGLLTDTLREILLEKVRKMKRIQKNPWNKSRQELQEIDKAILMNMEKLGADSKHRKTWGMQLGLLDETRIEKEDFSSKSSGVGNRGSRGSSNKQSPYQNSRRSGGSTGQRYGNYYGGSSNYGNSTGSSSYGGSRSGWATSNQTPSYYGSTGYQGYSQHQGYGNYGTKPSGTGYAGQQQAQSNYYSSSSSGNKRKSSDAYGGEWKRPRNF